ncbi:hypothetical protein ASE01_20525 [Nocardioides sp. Root190]|uniref:TraR/DksA family transcriptional regulator n=1 Tax=Nocardioides sp. Root190 TaxID=1736488 RepID=UPI0006F57B5A|nr:TraR/DksA C4-type zinc finger protein [Nocardioides sp. Root190]KRB73153.1 hypothetical protein ASE01_20525 [Nocardioides sp. Root190]
MTTLDTAMPTSRTEELRNVDRALEGAATNRRNQLERVADPGDDPVAVLQRAALRQTLTEIAAARQRIVAGTFGACTACRQPISPDRLEFRPWSATCIRCAGKVTRP